MCDIVVLYISVVLSFLAKRPDEDGVVLRGDEGDSIEIDERRHGHGSVDDQIRDYGQLYSKCDETRIGWQPLYAVLL